MQPNADLSPPDQPIERRLNVHQAAEALGITPEAVRSRIQRGTLAKEKGEDGTVYVRLNADQLRANADEHADRSSSAPDGTVDQSQLVERMASEIEHLREMLALRDEEIRRRDHLLAAALERIPALESPPGTPSEQPQREPPVRVSEEARKDEESEEEPSSEAAGRSWWQRWFGV
jgi:hypothetical protein